MSYETRRSQQYYYRARRVGDRIVKKYLGKGVAAKQAAHEDAQRKVARLEQRRRELQFENQLALLRDQFEQFWEASEGVLQVALFASNYYRRRGEWRRRRASGT